MCFTCMVYLIVVLSCSPSFPHVLTYSLFLFCRHRLEEGQASSWTRRLKVFLCCTRTKDSQSVGTKYLLSESKLCVWLMVRGTQESTAVWDSCCQTWTCLISLWVFFEIWSHNESSKPWQQCMQGLKMSFKKQQVKLPPRIKRLDVLLHASSFSFFLAWMGWINTCISAGENLGIACKNRSWCFPLGADFHLSTLLGRAVVFFKTASLNLLLLSIAGCSLGQVMLRKAMFVGFKLSSWSCSLSCCCGKLGWF